MRTENSVLVWSGKFHQMIPAAVKERSRATPPAASHTQRKPSSSITAEMKACVNSRFEESGESRSWKQPLVLYRHHVLHKGRVCVLDAVLEEPVEPR